MDFIFMLTRRDRTVEDCLEVFELIRPLGLKHVGFKDVGVDFRTLVELTRRIRASGAMVYMEVVNTSPEVALQSVRNALELGVDRLLGGTRVDEVMAMIAGSRVEYYPFPGFPEGHPTRLGGTPAEIEQHCRAFMVRGCAGVDLLAYRATEADPVELVRAARRGLGQGRLIVAGSIDSAERIRAMAEAGADDFTIGSAVFDCSYSPHKGSILSQLADVLADCRALSAEAAS